MKSDLPYFTHDNNALEHPKMQALITAYGFEGYGRFWALNEAIAACDGARLDLSRRVNRLALASRLRFSSAQLDDFLAFLADPDMDLITIKDEIITTDRTQEDYGRADAERQRKRKSYTQKKLDGENRNYPEETPFLPGETAILPGESTQSRVEKSREDKSSGRCDYSDPAPQKFSTTKTGAGLLYHHHLFKKLKEPPRRRAFLSLTTLPQN